MIADDVLDVGPRCMGCIMASIGFSAMTGALDEAGMRSQRGDR